MGLIGVAETTAGAVDVNASPIGSVITARIVERVSLTNLLFTADNPDPGRCIYVSESSLNYHKEITQI